MDIRLFSKYYKLSLEDKVIPIQCGIDQFHPVMVPNIDEEDQIYLYCLACNFKIIPGTELYRNITECIDKLNE